jgi:hypothetical protein
VRGTAFISVNRCFIEAPRRVSAVSSDNQADASLGPVNANTFMTGNRGHGLRKWMIASSCGTYHTPHYDANGLSTLVSVKEGLQAVGMGSSPLTFAASNSASKAREPLQVVALGVI